MTDGVLQKVEEKVTSLLVELKSLRFEVQQLKQENSCLTLEKLNHTQKLQELISLLDSIDTDVDSVEALFLNMPELEAM
jgi:regulator of replication initiation timing